MNEALTTLSMAMMPLSRSTQETYQEINRDFLMHCKKNGVTDVNEVTDKEVMSYLTRKVYAQATINIKIAALRYLKEALALSFQLPKPHKPKCTRIKYVEEADIQKLFALELKRRAKLKLLLLYTCGLRATEMCTIRLDDIKEDGTIFIIGKGDKPRVVGLLPEVQALLKTHLEKTIARRKMPSDHLFININGKPITRKALYAFVKRCGKRIGLPNLSPHMLRHSFATHCLGNGADVKIVSQALGHSDLSMTERYLHLTNKHVVNGIRNSFPTMNIGGAK